MTFNDLDRKLKQIDSNKLLIEDILSALSPGESKNLDDYFRIDLTYTSNSLEGNTLSIVDTKVLLEDNITPGGKNLWEVQEAVGHSDAFELLLKTARSSEKLELLDTIYQLHWLFYRAIDFKNAGKPRNCVVYVVGDSYTPPAPSLLPALMKEFEDDFEEKSQSLHPVELAAFAQKNDA
jgi:Fic family protein